MHIRDALYINGKWLRIEGVEPLSTHNPYDGSVFGQFVPGGEDEVELAVDSACHAQSEWAHTPVHLRAAVVRRMATYLESRVSELTDLLVAEVGMPIRWARPIQAEFPIANLRRYADLAEKFDFTQRVGNSDVRRVAVGVVAAITPWNYPLHQIVMKVAPALLAGCTVVLKPSEVTPLNAYLMADAAHAAGCPPGVFNLLVGTGAEIGRSLVAHPRVDKVSFTGSTSTGKAVAMAASAQFKRLTLELGGKSPSIVLPSADLERAVRSTVTRCMINSGQTCTALTRLLVPRELHDRAAVYAAEVVASMPLGDPRSPATRLGPLTTRAQREKVLGYVAAGDKEGACRYGDPEQLPGSLPISGNFVAPVVFSEVTPSMSIAKEEIFGPVLCVMPYDGESDALRIAESTEFGLAAAVWGGTDDIAREFALELRAGQIDINGGEFNALAPFGGFKKSGVGREAGVYGLDGFLEYQALQYRV
jgi:aldehyde dehydrogenase (NAD+)